MERATYVVGDVHGHLAKLVRVLAQAGLIKQDALFTDAPLWSGGAAALIFMGDLVDRGPAGMGVIRLALRLEQEAVAAGGYVTTLLGNHEPLLLAAARFGDMRVDEERTFRESWKINGGADEDMAEFGSRYADWIAARPAMLLVGASLLVHADSLIYQEYGSTIEEVNAAMGAILAGDDAAAFGKLLKDFVKRRVFAAAPPDGEAAARQFLAQYGGQRIVHGHTPVATLSGQDPLAVREPYIYAAGLVVDVDPGLYLGGDGFSYRLPD